MISEQPATVSTCVFQSVAPKESLSVYCWSRDPTFLYSVTRHVAVTCSLMPHICVTRPHQWRDATSRPACHCLFATRDRFKDDHLRRSASEKLFAIYVHALRMCNRVLPRVCTLLVLVGMTSWTVPMAPAPPSARCEPPGGVSCYSAAPSAARTRLPRRVA